MNVLPILEVEDPPFINVRSIASDPPAPNVPSIPAKPSHKEPITVQEPHLPRIDDHSVFWSTYDKLAGAHDRELLDGWNKSLDILLIFAGLFSAVNTAFIMESYKSLQPDPIETTNVLLRLLITHRNDNVTLSDDALNPSSKNSSAISINSVFFTSLSFSLTAAFGAVTAKQWLTEYSNTGGIKALHLQGRERQAKFKGLKNWHFRFIIDLLPILLQISLLLFLVGLVEFLWVLEWKVAAIQLVLTTIGLAVYLITLIIGLVFPTSPFQTPLSKYMLRIQEPWRGLSKIGGSLEQILGLTAFRQVYKEYFAPVMRRGRRCISQGVHLYSHRRSSKSTIITMGDVQSWDNKTTSAAESVVWLLEHSEHLDTTIVALDASLRLPSDLLLWLIVNQEGLRERLVEFHQNLESQLKEQGSKPVNELRDRVMLSTIAMFHLFKLDQNTEGLQRTWRYKFEEEDKVPFKVEARGEKIEVVRSLTVFKYEPFILQPFHLQIDITDARQISVTSPLGFSANPTHLLIEAIACDALSDFKKPLIPIADLEDDLRIKNVLLNLPLILGEKPSWITISHVAIVLAAIHWRIDPGPGVSHWGYYSAQDRHEFERVLRLRISACGKGEMVWENIALALSLLDRSCPDPLSLVHHRLISVAIGSFTRRFKMDPSVAQILLQAWIKNMGEEERQGLILRLLPFFARYLSPTIQNANNIIQLLQHGLSSQNPDQLKHDSPLLQLAVRLSDHPDDSFYRTIFLSEHGVLNSPNARPLIYKTGHLPGKLLHLISFSAAHSITLWNYQVALVLELLVANRTEEPYFDILPMVGSLHRLIVNEAGFRWPSYYPPDLVLKMEKIGQASFEDILMNAIDDLWFTSLKKAWLGDSTLLFWRAALKFHHEGRLPAEWNDSAFFESGVVDLMLDYYHHVTEQKYAEVDYDTLGRYFELALERCKDRGIPMSHGDIRGDGNGNRVTPHGMVEVGEVEETGSGDGRVSRIGDDTSIVEAEEAGLAATRLRSIAEVLRMLGRPTVFHSLS